MNEFVVKNGLIVSGSTNVSGSVTAQSFTGSFSGSFSAPGSNTQVIYNSASLLAASANLTFDGTTLTAACDIVVNGICVGEGGGNISSNTRVGINE